MQLVYFNEGVPSNMNALSFTEYIALNVMGVLLAMLLFVLVILVGVAVYREVLERMGKHVHKPFILGQDKIFLGVLSGIGETFNTHSLVVRILFIVFGIGALDLPITALAYGLLYLIMKRNTDDFVEYYQEELKDGGEWVEVNYCSMCGKPIAECVCGDTEDEWVTTEEADGVDSDIDIEDLAKDKEDDHKQEEVRREHPYYATNRTHRNISDRVKKANEQEDEGDKKQMTYPDEF